MYDFNRMEQLPHLSNLQKFLIFFHMAEKKKEQDKARLAGRLLGLGIWESLRLSSNGRIPGKVGIWSICG